MATTTKRRSSRKAAPEPRAQADTPRIVGDDVLTETIETEKPRFVVNAERDLKLLWEANPEVHAALTAADTLETARESVYAYLERAERAVFALESQVHILEKSTIREAVRVFRSVIGPINEKRTEFSALEQLWRLARGAAPDELELSAGFLMEFIHLFRAVAGRSGIYREVEPAQKGVPDYLKLHGREAALARSEVLDEMGGTLRKYFKRYPSGLDPEVRSWRRQNRERILRHFGATEADWNDPRWQLKHVIRDIETVVALLDVIPERAAALRVAGAARLPFGITPYYLSLMDRNPAIGYDHAVRAQVLPPPEYVEEMAAHRHDRSAAFDFMGEHDTSPVDLVTRRYPLISILKPYNTCAQICVYCQRNWEIDEVLAENAMAKGEQVDAAVTWLADHTALGDILITGGDPAVMGDRALADLLEKVAALEHVYRIRVGTRSPVVLPQRLTDAFCDVLGRFAEPGRREVAVVTHFEHSYEITPEACDAVQRLRRRGIGVYNQQVFTVENSRRFETAKLRRDLRLIGVDPYYTFNMKGKKETRRLMVPIARILQERKEEARLLPGMDRTDEPVFNVPRLGKNHLRAQQDHRLVMILPDGSRVYEFHPWEKNITPTPPYNYLDVPIYDYLEELAARGENIRDYRTIWYYY